MCDCGASAKVVRLERKIKDAINIINCMHETNKICVGKRLGECQREDCWVFRLVQMLKAA